MLLIPLCNLSLSQLLHHLLHLVPPQLHPLVLPRSLPIPVKQQAINLPVNYLCLVHVTCIESFSNKQILKTVKKEMFQHGFKTANSVYDPFHQ